jgi:hypothetical protein
MHDLVKFYHDEPNPSGYMFSEVVGWPDNKLEEVHNFVQWIFPIPERSRYVVSTSGHFRTIPGFEERTGIIAMRAYASWIGGRQ